LTASGTLGKRTVVLSSLIVIFALSASTRSQERNPNGRGAHPSLSPELNAQLASIRDAALTDDYAMQQVAHLTENIGPRLSGSPQATQAARYVGDELRKLGC
jgi:hypothetical protein